VVSFDLNCDYVNDEFSFLGTIYFCEMINAEVTVRETVASVSTSHSLEKSNTEVKALFVRDKTLRFVPDGFNKFFSNIEGVDIYNSQLKEISSDDLKQFPKLRGLWIRYNQVEKLESGLFEFNEKLEYISFGWNKIMHIGVDLFTPLKNLKKAFFPKNICIDEGGDSPTALQELKDEIKEKCQPSKEMKRTENFNAENFEKLQNDVNRMKLCCDNNINVNSTDTDKHSSHEETASLQQQIHDLLKILNEQRSELDVLKVKLLKVEEKVH
jgi:hypothetical protein